MSLGALYMYGWNSGSTNWLPSQVFHLIQVGEDGRKRRRKPLLLLYTLTSVDAWGTGFLFILCQDRYQDPPPRINKPVAYLVARKTGLPSECLFFVFVWVRVPLVCKQPFFQDGSDRFWQVASLFFLAYFRGDCRGRFCSRWTTCRGAC